MDWKAKLGARVDEKAQKAIEENWPKIQQLFQEKVGPAALAAAGDDEAMQKLFKVVYMALPFPLNMAVKEEAFVKFCFDRRNALLPGRPAGAA